MGVRERSITQYSRNRRSMISVLCGISPVWSMNQISHIPMIPEAPVLNRCFSTNDPLSLRDDGTIVMLSKFLPS